MKERDNQKGLPIIVGIGVLLILGTLGQSFWTVLGGAAFMAFATYGALNYKSPPNKYDL